MSKYKVKLEEEKQFHYSKYPLESRFEYLMNVLEPDGKLMSHLFKPSKSGVRTGAQIGSLIHTVQPLLHSNYRTHKMSHILTSYNG